MRFEDLPQKLYEGKPAKSEYSCICLCGVRFFGHKRDSICPDCENNKPEKKYHFDHILNAVNGMFNGSTLDSSGLNPIFSWRDNHVEIGQPMLNDERLSDIDMAMYIGRKFVDLGMTI